MATKAALRAALGSAWHTAAEAFYDLIASDGANVGGETITSLTVNDVTGGDSSLDIVGQAAAQGGSANLKGGASSTSGNAGGAASIQGGAPGATGVGGAANVTAAAGGATSGTGGAANVTAGAGTAGNANGGSVVLTAGAQNGSGIAGGVRLANGILIRKQATPAAKTTSTTLTGAEIAGLLITANQGAAGAASYQMPTGTNLQNALPADMAIGEAFDFHIINISTVAAEDVTVTTNTDITLVGGMVVNSNDAGTSISFGHFRALKTADHVFSVYRIG